MIAINPYSKVSESTRAEGSAAESKPARTGRLMVMSNRAPVRIVRQGAKEHVEPTVGGVASTFMRLLERRGGLWIAWSGGKKAHARLELPVDEPRFAMNFVPLREDQISHYYYGMCNKGLWPLMHFMISSCNFAVQNWNHYVRANEMFASMAADEAKPGDMLWVQDFHLALTPRLFRERHSKVPVGLFWHVPFPPDQVFRVFPWRRELLGGMLGSDLIGFHCRSYANNFLGCCARLFGASVDYAKGEIGLDGRKVKVVVLPLGISASHFASLAMSERVRERTQRIRRGLHTPIVILGADRLDYTKGILERLLGYERFLETNPSYHRRVTLVQIAVPSRTRMEDYAALKRQLDELVGRIVGRFSSDGWVPIRYLYTQFNVEELVAYYQAADVALLTPLRDGMNLVAKEYVAARPDDNAVLILSEFAGAAEELTDALMVNPYNIDEIASRLKEAVEMDPVEKAARLRSMRSKVHRNDLDRWSGVFLETLARERSVAEKSAAGSPAR